LPSGQPVNGFDMNGADARMSGRFFVTNAAR
jgi:hypothetical protein